MLLPVHEVHGPRDCGSPLEPAASEHRRDTRLGPLFTFAQSHLPQRLLYIAAMELPTTYHEGDQSGAAINSSPGHFAFLNHSSSTLPHNLPPKVDDKPLARQKRKRTRYNQATDESAWDRL